MRPSPDDVYVVLNRSDTAVTVSVPVRWPDGTRVGDNYRERMLAAEGLIDVIPEEARAAFQRELIRNLHLFAMQPGWGDFSNVTGV